MSFTCGWERCETVRIQSSKHSPYPVLILQYARQPKQQRTAITTGTATNTVLATLKELPEFLAGLRGGGVIVVEVCGIT